MNDHNTDRVAPDKLVATNFNAEEVLEAANDSAYGLGGNLWTRDVERGEALARRIASGSVFVNGMTASDPLLPFGGVKRRGNGQPSAAALVDAVPHRVAFTVNHQRGITMAQGMSAMVPETQ